MNIALKSKLNPHAPMLARIALSFARSPKRIKRFAAFINARVDIPKLTEDQEQEAIESAVTVALDAAQAALDGKPVLSIHSLRDTTEQAVRFLDEHIDELAQDAHIPYVPDVLKSWALEEIHQALHDRVIPWIEQAPALKAA